MFDAEVTHALRFLNPHFYACHPSGATFSIEETKKDGQACLDVTTPLPCIHVQNPDKHPYGLLQLQNCADHIILKYHFDSNTWDIHIFEFKKTITKDRWKKKILPQFHGGLQNTYAVFCISKHRTYKISMYTADTVKMPAKILWQSKSCFSAKVQKVPTG